MGLAVAVGSGTCSAEAHAFAGRLAKHPAVSGALVLPQDRTQRGTCWMELGLSGEAQLFHGFAEACQRSTTWFLLSLLCVAHVLKE